ncbi:hypothetical protein BH708_09905 [Brachybacterium sp. P6-10-X1]|uniref:GNAT family N-acetyltransferase n=1 Tax=Brachybacterium sp. P6-10-X1 TaxID=1903186 RepID=UPI000971779A|nr:GNAT family N-acetyltransferase [Brachybacterium sp. P6-10-X1]APX32974.1 hypothetical protein BH708_09905 [Brachybacterium sp. P6-10-X1]
MSPLVLVDATADDIGVLERAIHAAWRWREAWDEDSFTRHRATCGADSYIDDFGRRAGDIGVIARDSGTGRAIGAAWCRFFTVVDHRAGFLAEDVPELVVAVEQEARGRGVGRALMEALLHRAREYGVDRVSLHVSRENDRARRLYEALGFSDSGCGDEQGAVLVRSTANVPR